MHMEEINQNLDTQIIPQRIVTVTTACYPWKIKKVRVAQQNVLCRYVHQVSGTVRAELAELVLLGRLVPIVIY